MLTPQPHTSVLQRPGEGVLLTLVLVSLPTLVVNLFLLISNFLIFIGNFLLRNFLMVTFSLLISNFVIRNDYLLILIAFSLRIGRIILSVIKV